MSAMSESTPVANSNPRKRRRLNNNLATTDRMQVMHGIEQRKVERLKGELLQASQAKDAALKELGKIKSDTISQIESKNKEIKNIQEKLKWISQENTQSKQMENTLKHKIEIFEAEIDSLQKENFKLRAKVFNNNKNDKASDDNQHSTTPNGHGPSSSTNDKSINYELECIKLKKELQIQKVNVSSQNEEILRLQTQIEQLNHNSVSTTESLNKASKHIQRLQQQIKEKTENQSDLAKLGIFCSYILFYLSLHSFFVLYFIYFFVVQKWKTFKNHLREK